MLVVCTVMQSDYFQLYWGTIIYMYFWLCWYELLNTSGGHHLDFCLNSFCCEPIKLGCTITKGFPNLNLEQRFIAYMKLSTFLLPNAYILNSFRELAEYLLIFSGLHPFPGGLKLTSNYSSEVITVICQCGICFFFSL